MNVVSRLSLESVFSFFMKDVDKFCNSLAELYSNISKVSSTKYRVLHWVSLCLGSGFRIYFTKILFVPGSTFIYIYLPICKPINFHRFIAFCECFSTKNLQRINSEYSALKH